MTAYKIEHTKHVKDVKFHFKNVDIYLSNTLDYKVIIFKAVVYIDIME